MALSKKQKEYCSPCSFFTLLCFIGGLYGGGVGYYKLTNISLDHLTYHSLFDQWQASPSKLYVLFVFRRRPY